MGGPISGQGPRSVSTPTPTSKTEQTSDVQSSKEDSLHRSNAIRNNGQSSDTAARMEKAKNAVPGDEILGDIKHLFREEKNTQSDAALGDAKHLFNRAEKEEFNASAVKTESDKAIQDIKYLFKPKSSLKDRIKQFFSLIRDIFVSKNKPFMGESVAEKASSTPVVTDVNQEMKKIAYGIANKQIQENGSKLQNFLNENTLTVEHLKALNSPAMPGASKSDYLRSCVTALYNLQTNSPDPEEQKVAQNILGTAIAGETFQSWASGSSTSNHNKILEDAGRAEKVTEEMLSLVQSFVGIEIKSWTPPQAMTDKIHNTLIYKQNNEASYFVTLSTEETHFI